MSLLASHVYRLIDGDPAQPLLKLSTVVHVHRGLGVKGVVTNGSIRDIPMNASHFQLLAGSVMPSHAHVHVVAMDVPVTVAGMAVQPNDLIHADQHGAVVIPYAAA